MTSESSIDRETLPAPISPAVHADCFSRKVTFSGKAFDRTVVTSSLFEYLRPLDGSNEKVVDLTGIEPVTS